MITFQRLSESVCCSWRNAGRNCASLKHCIDQHQSHAPRSGRRKKCYSRKRWCFFWKDPRTAPSGPPIGLGNPISGWKRRGMQVCVRTASIDGDSNPVWAKLPLAAVSGSSSFVHVHNCCLHASSSSSYGRNHLGLIVSFHFVFSPGDSTVPSLVAQLHRGHLCSTNKIFTRAQICL